MFDGLILGGRNMMGETLATLRELLKPRGAFLLDDPVREAPRFDAAVADLASAICNRTFSTPI